MIKKIGNLNRETNKISPNKQCFQWSIFLFGVIWTAVSQNIDIEKRDKIYGWEQFADLYFIGTSNTEKIADALVQKGFKSIDAVHIACAIESKCDYFLTTDKGILSKKGLISEVKIANSIEYVIETGDNNEK